MTDALAGLDHQQRESVQGLSEALARRPDLTKAQRREKVAEAVERYRSKGKASTLEQRAAQARIDLTRASALSHYSEEVKRGRAKPPPVVVLAPYVPPRYCLGPCLDCSRELWVHSPKPRVPLCQTCAKRRAKAKPKPVER